jgi:hypothetical protein
MDETLDYTVPTNESLFPVEYKSAKSTFTIKVNIKSDFDLLCEKMRLNKSMTIQMLMENFVENNKEKTL